MDRAYTPTTPASAPIGNGAVLDGIKEGVQEVGRILVAGLDLSGVSSAPTADATKVTSHASHHPRASLSLAMRRARHINNQSVSSDSTSGTSTSGSSGTTQRLSQSSASSLEDLIESKDAEDETISAARRSSGDILISPTAESSAAKVLRRRSRDTKAPSPLALSSAVSPSPTQESSTSPVAQQTSAPVVVRSTSALPMATLAQPVSSWVGSMGSSVGKKWEELQKAET